MSRRHILVIAFVGTFLSVDISACAPAQGLPDLHSIRRRAREGAAVTHPCQDVQFVWADDLAHAFAFELIAADCVQSDWQNAGGQAARNNALPGVLKKSGTAHRPGKGLENKPKRQPLKNLPSGSHPVAAFIRTIRRRRNRLVNIRIRTYGECQGSVPCRRSPVQSRRRRYNPHRACYRCARKPHTGRCASTRHGSNLRQSDRRPD